MKHFNPTIYFFISLIFLFGNIQAQNIILMQKKKLTGFEDNPCHIAFSSKSGMFAIATSGAATELYDKNFDKIWVYKGPGNAGAGDVVFTPDEKYLIFTKFQAFGDLVVLRLSDKKPIQQIKAHEEYINHLDISPDGKTLVTVGNDSKVKVFRWKNEQFVLTQTLSVQVSERAYSEHANVVRFSPDSKFFIIGGRMGNARFDTQEKLIDGKISELQVYMQQGDEYKLFQSLPERYDIYDIAFHPKGQYFVASTSERLLTFKLSGGKFIADKSHADADYMSSLSFSTDGKYLGGNRMNTFKIWEWKNGSITTVNENEMSRLSLISIAFSPDKNYFVSMGMEKEVVFWEMPDAPIAKTETIPTKGNDISPTEPKKTDPKKSETKDLEEFQPSVAGKNFLLVIGINSYKYWNPLTNAQKDAQDIKKVLTTRYTFEPQNVFELYNQGATAKNILAKIAEVRQKLSGNDNLLIYFSGHGFYNAEIEEGYWIPVDAQKGQETEYLPNSTLLKYIKSLPARHVFLVADACFSGSLISASSRGYVENVEQFKSRRCLTSGRLEYVSDGTAGKNSPFATYFIKFLQENTKKKIACSELEQYVKTSVGNNSEQTPLGNAMKNAGDEGGEFVFYLK
jgi:hypothetical protein